MDIKISAQLEKKLKERIKSTNFKSIQEYVEYILKQVILAEDSSSDKAYTGEEEAQLKKELENMGYI